MKTEVQFITCLKLLESRVYKEQYRAFAIKTVDSVSILGRVKTKTMKTVIHSFPAGIKFRENLPNSQKFRGPTQSGRSQGSQR